MRFANSAAQLTRRSSAASAIDAAERRLADFVERRMDEHYVTRIERLLGGQHPHNWHAMPAEAVCLAGNDYLCLAGEGQLPRAQMNGMADMQGTPLMSAVYLQEGS